MTDPEKCSVLKPLETGYTADILAGFLVAALFLISLIK